ACVPRYLHSFPTRRSSDLIGSCIRICSWVFKSSRITTNNGLILIYIKKEWIITWSCKKLHVITCCNNGVTTIRSNVHHIWCYTRSEEHTSELQSRENLVCR